MDAVSPPAPVWNIKPVDYPHTNPGLVSARGCLRPIFNKQHANMKPQHQADSYDVNLAGGSRKHKERKHHPSAIMEKMQPSQNQSSASCGSSMANAESRQIHKHQLEEVQGNTGNRLRNHGFCFSCYLSLIAQALWVPTHRRNPTARRCV